jgi:hypothetical protein
LRAEALQRAGTRRRNDATAAYQHQVTKYTKGKKHISKGLKTLVPSCLGGGFFLLLVQGFSSRRRVKPD